MNSSPILADDDCPSAKDRPVYGISSWSWGQRRWRRYPTSLTPACDRRYARSVSRCVFDACTGRTFTRRTRARARLSTRLSSQILTNRASYSVSLHETRRENFKYSTLSNIPLLSWRKIDRTIERTRAYTMDTGGSCKVSTSARYLYMHITLSEIMKVTLSSRWKRVENARDSTTSPLILVRLMTCNILTRYQVGQSGFSL
jgi:hypothetical protein